MVQHLFEKDCPERPDRPLRRAAIVAANRPVILMAVRQAVIGAAARLAVDFDRNVHARSLAHVIRRNEPARTNPRASRFRRGFPPRSAGSSTVPVAVRSRPM